MERAVVVGNCQATAIEMMLSTNDEFTRRFELVRFPPVHEIPEAMVPELQRAVGSAAVLVAQRIDDGYRDGIGLGTDTLAAIAASSTVVRWPSVYWAGYFPDLFYLRDEARQPVLDGQFDYHDRTILEAYAEGTSVTGACSLLEDPERLSGALEWAEQATAELDVRGEDCDVQVADFIASHFRDELLFYTMNHPTNLLLGYIAQQVIDLLGVPGRVNPAKMPGEVLGSTFYPLHANHVRALGLRFGEHLRAGRTPFRIRGTTYDSTQAVGAFYEYYAAHPRLVEVNVHSGSSSG